MVRVDSVRPKCDAPCQIPTEFWQEQKLVWEGSDLVAGGMGVIWLAIVTWTQFDLSWLDYYYFIVTFRKLGS